VSIFTISKRSSISLGSTNCANCSNILLSMDTKIQLCTDFPHIFATEPFYRYRRIVEELGRTATEVSWIEIQF
ncbi:MAG: hypothetical protein IJZ11_04830, partial [Bacteroidaceae bacterium]|nr:hypothetical protein [Bacteroidaceae bacterium]